MEWTSVSEVLKGIRVSKKWKCIDHESNTTNRASDVQKHLTIKHTDGIKAKRMESSKTEQYDNKRSCCLTYRARVRLQRVLKYIIPIRNEPQEVIRADRKIVKLFDNEQCFK